MEVRLILDHQKTLEPLSLTSVVLRVSAAYFKLIIRITASHERNLFVTGAGNANTAIMLRKRLQGFSI